jgi:hypothetical protein
MLRGGGKAEKSKDRYQKKKNKGICVDCPNRAAPGSIRCLACKLKHLEREVNRLVGLCSSCKRVLPPYDFEKTDKCPDCKDRAKEWEEK